jgi:hypothetical protein
VTRRPTRASWQVCDDSIKLTKCFDAKLTCKNWNVCDCCSPVPLHKCLLPTAGRAFGPDCSSPIDAREECCGDAFTHLRAFKGLADIQHAAEDAVESVVETAEAAADAAKEGVESAKKTAQELADEAKAKLEEAKAAVEDAIN